MKHIILWIMTGALLLCGCVPASGNGPETAAPTEPETQQETGPVPANNGAAAFALALFNAVADTKEKNPVISPASAYLALAMAANGGNGQTLAQFENVLGGNLTDVNELSKALLSAWSQPSGSTRLQVADAMWADRGLQLSKAYQDAVSETFQGEINSVDLAGDEARNEVNEWVNAKTNGMIPAMREENYPAGTLLALVNTVYFKGLWQDDFSGDMTMDDTFTMEDGQKVTAPFLWDGECTRQYFSTEAGDGVVLPYDDGSTVFVAIRPTEGESARALGKRLTVQMLNGCIAAGADTYMNFSMPRFSLDWQLDMADTLRQMGLSDPFDPAKADLTAIGTAQGQNLYISSVQQKVKIIVDEKGTEAAAATEIGMAGAAYMEEQPKEVKLETPFVYAVVDLGSGVPLFMGVLDSPK